MSFTLPLHKIVLPCMLTMSVLGGMQRSVCAARSASEFGRVNMQGSIIDTPCAIATEDLHQSIDMKVISVGEILLNGRSQPQIFSLNLVNCDLKSQSPEQPDITHFSTTFDGPSEHDLFIISGVSGMGIQIADSAGHVALPGRPLTPGLLASGSQRLDYSLRLVSNAQPLKVGDYHAILRFKVDYF